MPGGEDEAVAIEPARLFGIEAQDVAEEDGPDLGAAERQAEMAGGAAVHGIHGEAASFIGGAGEGIDREFHSGGKERPE